MYRPTLPSPAAKPARAEVGTRALRSRVLAAAMGSAVTLLIALGLVMTKVTLTKLEQEEGHKLMAKARYFSELLDMTIGRQLMDLESRAALLPLLNLHHQPKTLAQWLTTIQATIPEYTWIGFADAQGRVMASGNNVLQHQNVASRDWYRQGRDHAVTVDLHDAKLLSDYLPQRPDGQPWRFIDITAPVRNEHGALLGVLGAHLSWDWLIAQHQRFSESLSRQRNTEIVVAGPDGYTRLLGPAITASNLQELASLKAAHSGASGWVQETWPDGQTYLVGYSKNPGYGPGHQLDWVTLVRVPLQEAVTVWHSSVTGLWLLIAGFIGVSLLAMYRLLGRTLRPVEALISTIRSVARNGGRVQADPGTPHEFVLLTQATNQLIAAMEARRTADQAKSRFLADMSHEIRTPLHGLIGHAELLKTRLHTADDQADIQQIIACARDLTELVNDLLDLSAIEEQKMRFVQQPFRLSELIDTNIHLFAPLAHEKSLVLSVVTDFDQSPTVVSDRLRLGQIIKNLLSNAVKFTAKGRIDVAVHVVCIMGPPSPKDPTELQAVLRISVHDTGIGLTREQRELVFGRFQQANGETPARYGGSGLGLSVCRALVQAMGGVLDLDSTPGEGTRIAIAIPVTPVVAAVMDTPVSPPTEEHATARSLQILVVDDIAMNRSMLSRWLTLLGHQVDEAETGRQALALTQAKCYDLILMDIDLPDISGWEIIRSIRQSDRPCAGTRILAVSGHAFENDITASRQAGFDGHLSKPLAFDALRRELSRLCV